MTWSLPPVDSLFTRPTEARVSATNLPTRMVLIFGSSTDAQASAVERPQSPLMRNAASYHCELKEGIEPND